MTAVTVTRDSTMSCDEPAIADMLKYHMAQLGIHEECPLGVVFVDEPRMTELHEHWLGEPGPTDVLSFPMDEVRGAQPGEPPAFGVLGDIVVCLPVAAAQAQVNSRTVDEEVQFLITHGLLHLLGFDHALQDEYDAMFRLQDDLLHGWRSAT